MKKNRFKILTVACVVGANLMFSSCVDNLLNQTPGGELASSLYWKTESDAEYAVNGVYSQARAMFNRDYVFDGNTEYLRFRGNVGTSQATGDRSIAYRNGSYNNPSSTYGSSFDNYYQYAYATVNRANYAIQNIEKMLPDAKTEESKAKLEAFIGEAKMLRGMAYFRLISMWGDVPYFDKIIESNDEVANISRTSITEGGATANDEITTSEVTIIAGEGNVTIANAAGKKVVVSNILGQVVATQVLTSDNAVIAAPQGVVVVAVEGDEAVKAIVR